MEHEVNAITSTRVSLWTGSGRTTRAVIALTPEALWVQETWRQRALPLASLGKVESRCNGRELTLSFWPEPSGETITLSFASADEGNRWHNDLQAAREQPLPATPTDQRRPEGVALLRQTPDVPHVALGHVNFADHTSWAADRGLQLHAGMLGADAVI